ncbi:hypothetical protein LK994_03815 [Ferruginibacter lapsinanis]|uniref:hypothetical protein n=1 Tax=Ferruginibacter lapsinanis TaxID=563172 RepID=UPI001E60B8F1|nr:hypothetical protein [Ferruginibacter lapsinanis]UEG50597.1 hypothetical protein LK994_03815 [Ferruginibacter lapsinanis]
MNIQAVLFRSFLFFTFLFFTFSIQAQSKKKERKKEFYFSWGYNKEWYTKSTVKVNQPSLGNHYSFVNIKGHDHPGWDEALFTKAISIPQYNYRLGLFINKKKGLAVEINFDHTKFIFADQQARVKGTLGNRVVDTIVNFNKPNGFNYYLNNGANFLLFNIVKRWHWVQNKKQTIKVDALGKAGIGPVIPHVENTLFGDANKAGFQLGGWNIGVEAAVRATFFDYIFLEYSNKLDYARYSDLKVYEGTAKHAFGTYEMVASLGVTFPVGGKVKK